MRTARPGPLQNTVKLDKFVKQLRREATASPKKAVVLGLLGVVALWFWAPLVLGWIGSDDAQSEAAKAVAPVAIVASPAAVSPDTNSKEAEGRQHNWRQLDHWMNSDPRTLAATLVSDARDPFCVSRTEVVKAKPTEEVEEFPLEVTPESLGMSLSSTIIGPRRRLARIDGKTYEQGKLVTLVKDEQRIEFNLLQVHSRHVVLEREGERYELKIPSRASAGRIEILAGAN